MVKRGPETRLNPKFLEHVGAAPIALDLKSKGFCSIAGRYPLEIQHSFTLGIFEVAELKVDPVSTGINPAGLGQNCHGPGDWRDLPSLFVLKTWNFDIVLTGSYI